MRKTVPSVEILQVQHQYKIHINTQVSWGKLKNERTNWQKALNIAED